MRDLRDWTLVISVSLLDIAGNRDLHKEIRFTTDEAEGATLFSALGRMLEGITDTTIQWRRQQ